MEPESNHIAYEINQPLEDFKNILNSSNFFFENQKSAILEKSTFLDTSGVGIIKITE